MKYLENIIVSCKTKINKKYLWPRRCNFCIVWAMLSSLGVTVLVTWHPDLAGVLVSGDRRWMLVVVGGHSVVVVDGGRWWW